MPATVPVMNRTPTIFAVVLSEVTIDSPFRHRSSAVGVRLYHILLGDVDYDLALGAALFQVAHGKVKDILPPVVLLFYPG